MTTKETVTYEGRCLCKETSFIARSAPSNPHLCSCTMCQKSSGAPTVAWVDFDLDTFLWTGKAPNTYQSSRNVQRCSCQNCGGLLAAMSEGRPKICVTTASLKSPDLIIPGEQHSYKESAPKWWDVRILRQQ